MTRVLLTMLSDDVEATKRARREVGYDQLVIFTPDPESEAVEAIREWESFTGDEVQVLPVDPGDLLGTLRCIGDVIQAHRDDTVRFQVNGGDNRLTHPAILACFQHGIDAWFCTSVGTERLPVLRQAQVEERFSPEERTVLRVLDGGAPVMKVVERSGLPRNRAMDALLGLKRKGLLVVDGQTVQLNDGGAYYRDHLVPSDT